MRQLMKNGLFSGWSKLVGSNAIAGVLQLLGFAIAAHSLDVAALGLIVIIQTYARVVDSFFNFQSVNVLTRFLAEARASGDEVQFRGIVKAGFLVDVFTAILATVIAAGALPFVAPLLGLSDQWIVPAMIFCLIILTRILGAPEAILRSFDAFWGIGLRGALQGGLMVSASAAAWLSGAPAETFLWIWLGSEVAANAIFIAWSLIALRKNNIRGITQADARLAVRNSPGFWTMLWQTNVTFAIRLLSQDVDVLIAGSVLGPAAAGLLRAAKNLAGVVNQLGRPLQQVASAPISRMVAARQFTAMMQYARWVCLSAGGASLLIVAGAMLLGGMALGILFGPEFAAAKWPLVFLLLTAAFYMFGIVMLPLTIALGDTRIFFQTTLVGTVIFYATILMLIGPLGITGIALAHVAFNGSWLVLSWSMVRRKMRNLRSHIENGTEQKPAPLISS